MAVLDSSTLGYHDVYNGEEPLEIQRIVVSSSSVSITRTEDLGAMPLRKNSTRFNISLGHIRTLVAATSAGH